MSHIADPDPSRPAIDRLTAAFFTAFQPPAALTASEWADRYFFLSPESAANPGKWTTFPYQREILDSITDPSIEEIWVQKSARMGFTKMLGIAIGYHLHQEPCPILFVQPTIKDAKGVSREEIDPMLRDVPVLASLIQDIAGTGRRTKDNSLYDKIFSGPNGQSVLSLVGANSPTGFRRTSRRLVLFDEVDGYPESAGAEGDQIELGKRRSEYYSNRKVIAGSTPTLKDLSRIEKGIKETDQRRRFMPCPLCGHMQYLQWGGKEMDFGIKWRNNDPETAAYLCEKCHNLFPHHHIRWMDAHGEWAATAEGKPKKRGYYMWTGFSYSPNATWPHIVAERIAAKASRQKEITFIQTVLGEPVDVEGTQADPKELAKRLITGWKPYQVPDGAALLAQSVDAQNTWLECQTIAIGPGERAWLIDHEVIQGSPKDPETWAALDEWRRIPRIRQDTKEPMAVEICLIDCNFETPSVIAYVRPRYRQKVFACRGEEKMALKAMVKKGTTRKEKSLFYRIATWDFKSIIAERLTYADDRPGRIYLPDWISDSYLQQITSEKLVKDRNRRTGREKLTWVKTQDRNEALDLWVYGLAALHVLQEFYGRKKYSDLDALHRHRAKPTAQTQAQSQAPIISKTETVAAPRQLPIANAPKLPPPRRR
jgi:phage terminase large subunit GpA-like protein